VDLAGERQQAKVCDQQMKGSWIKRQPVLRNRGKKGGKGKRGMVTDSKGKEKTGRGSIERKNGRGEEKGKEGIYVKEAVWLGRPGWEGAGELMEGERSRRPQRKRRE